MAKKREVPFLALPVKRGLNLASFWKILRLLRREKINIIHTHSSKDSWITFPLYLAGWTVVRSRHVLLGDKTTINRTFFFRYGCSRIIATANKIQDDLIRRFGVRSDKVDVVGEGIDFRKFNPTVDGSRFRKQFQVPPGTLLVGMIGMIRKQKGQAQFIEAALRILKSNPNVRFVLAGTATESMRAYEEQCRQRIEEAGASNSILMPGYIDDVPGLIASLDLMVVPSYSEAQSRVVPEAFAMRKPVIASSAGGLPELIHDGVNGLLVPPGDTPSLVNAIERLLGDLTLREKLAYAGYQKACPDLSFDRLMEATLSVYHKACVAK